MTSENDGRGANGGDPKSSLEQAVAHLTETAPDPVLAIEGERLTFILDGLTVHVPLRDLLKAAAAGHGLMGLLLYAVVLKLHDVDNTMRRALKLSEDQIARVSSKLGPDEAIGAIVRHLKEMGFPMPGQGGPGS